MRTPSGSTSAGCSPTLPSRRRSPGCSRRSSRLARRLAPDARPPAAGRPPRPPLDAFENYIKGLIAESPAAQATFLETAVKPVRRVRSRASSRCGMCAPNRAITRRRWRPRAAVTAGIAARRARAFPVRRVAARSEALRRSVRAVQGARRRRPGAAARNRTEAGGAALNNLGVVAVRRGGNAADRDRDLLPDQSGRRRRRRRRTTCSISATPTCSSATTRGPIYWLREAVRRDPADADAHYVLAAALQAAGSAVEARREKELARQLSSRYEELERRAGRRQAAGPAEGSSGPHRSGARRRTSRPEQAIVNSAQREQRELAPFHLDRGRRLYEREEDRGGAGRAAARRLPVAVRGAGAPAHRPDSPPRRPPEGSGRRAEDLDLERRTPPPHGSRSREAYLKLQKPAAARTELERALVLDPASADAKRMLGTIK